MSDTPRTDALLIAHEMSPEPMLLIKHAHDMSPEPEVLIKHAQELERELNAANERIKRLEEAGDELCGSLMYTGFWKKVEAWKQAKEDK